MIEPHALDESYESWDIISGVCGRIDVDLGFTVEKAVFLLFSGSRRWNTVLALRTLDLHHGTELL